MKRLLSIFAVIFILLCIVVFFFTQPRGDRFWSDDATVTPEIIFSEDGFNINNLRDWSYQDGEVVSRSFIAQEYSFYELDNTYYALQYLDKRKLTAHTFLIFEFVGGRELALSIEARKESEEEYSSLRGIFNAFELIYVWGTGEDITSRRTDLYQKEVERYELLISQSEQQAILKSLLEETQSLIAEPRFYNTLFRNCTNLLATQVNQLQPGSIPYHYSFILTGHSVQYLRNLGYIK